MCQCQVIAKGRSIGEPPALLLLENASLARVSQSYVQTRTQGSGEHPLSLSFVISQRAQAGTDAPDAPDESPRSLGHHLGAHHSELIHGALASDQVPDEIPDKRVSRVGLGRLELLAVGQLGYRRGDGASCDDEYTDDLEAGVLVVG